METEIKNLKNIIFENNKTIEKLKSDINIEKEEKMDILNELDRFKQDVENQRRMWSEDTAKLREELENMNEIVKTSEKGAEENLKERLEAEKLLILNEADSDREQYQKLLSEYQNLEQFCDELKLQLRGQGHLGVHRRNVSDISSISVMDEHMSSDVPEDYGYGSVRSTASNNSVRERLDNVDWKVEGKSRKIIIIFIIIIIIFTFSLRRGQLHVLFLLL